MKTYAVRKVKNGYQVVWFYNSDRYGSYSESENKVAGGVHKNLADAENQANNLAYECRR